jgi:hypothetical protein
VWHFYQKYSATRVENVKIRAFRVRLPPLVRRLHEISPIKFRFPYSKKSPCRLSHPKPYRASLFLKVAVNRKSFSGVGVASHEANRSRRSVFDNSLVASIHSECRNCGSRYANELLLSSVVQRQKQRGANGRLWLHLGDSRCHFIFYLYIAISNIACILRLFFRPLQRLQKCLSLFPWICSGICLASFIRSASTISDCALSCYGYCMFFSPPKKSLLWCTL